MGLLLLAAAAAALRVRSVRLVGARGHLACHLLDALPLGRERVRVVPDAVAAAADAAADATRAADAAAHSADARLLHVARSARLVRGVRGLRSDGQLAQPRHRQLRASRLQLV